MPPTAAVTNDVGIVSANHLGVVHAYCAAGVDADGALSGEQDGAVGGILSLNTSGVTPSPIAVVRLASPTR